jgi:PII-like signaling protein
VRSTHLKLTSYFAARQRTGQQYLADAMLDLFADRNIATSVMLRGIASFGPRHIIRSDQSLTLSLPYNPPYNPPYFKK